MAKLRERWGVSPDTKIVLQATHALSPEERAGIDGRASAEFALSQMQMKTLAVYDELLGTHLAEAFADPPSLAAVSLGGG